MPADLRARAARAVARTPQILVPDGMVLGLQIDDGQMFERLLEEVDVPLGDGDLFLFYTDGISETMNAEGECFGDDRLAGLLERARGSAAGRDARADPAGGRRRLPGPPRSRTT